MKLGINGMSLVVKSETASFEERALRIIVGAMTCIAAFLSIWALFRAFAREGLSLDQLGTGAGVSAQSLLFGEMLFIPILALLGLIGLSGFIPRRHRNNVVDAASMLLFLTAIGVLLF